MSKDRETLDHVGVFIPLPEDLAAQFPSKDEDTSKPHITLLYVGELDPSRVSDLKDAVASVARTRAPFTVIIEDYGEFQNDEGKTIPHMIPRMKGGFGDLAGLHEQLKRAVFEGEEIPIKHHPGPFKPHVTLAYLDEGKVYTGPKPTGSFEVSEIELWIGDQVARFPLEEDEAKRVYRDDKGEAGGQWVTIGAKNGKGGSPVFIKGGEITKGAGAVKGKKIAAVDRDKAQRESLTASVKVDPSWAKSFVFSAAKSQEKTARTKEGLVTFTKVKKGPAPAKPVKPQSRFKKLAPARRSRPQRKESPMRAAARRFIESVGRTFESELAESERRLARAQFFRDSVHYAEKDKGRWVTIGASEVSTTTSRGTKTKKTGGTPVFIKGGVIEKGPKGLAGKAISKSGKISEKKEAKGPEKKSKNKARNKDPRTIGLREKAEKIKEKIKALEASVTERDGLSRSFDKGRVGFEKRGLRKKRERGLERTIKASKKAQAERSKLKSIEAKIKDIESGDFDKRREGKEARKSKKRKPRSDMSKALSKAKKDLSIYGKATLPDGSSIRFDGHSDVVLEKPGGEVVRKTSESPQGGAMIDLAKSMIKGAMSDKKGFDDSRKIDPRSFFEPLQFLIFGDASHREMPEGSKRRDEAFDFLMSFRSEGAPKTIGELKSSLNKTVSNKKDRRMFLELAINGGDIEKMSPASLIELAGRATVKGYKERRIAELKKRMEDEGGKSSYRAPPQIHYSADDSKGVWRTIKGAKVFIEGGKITKGPDRLKGLSRGKNAPKGTKGTKSNPRDEFKSFLSSHFKNFQHKKPPQAQRVAPARPKDLGQVRFEQARNKALRTLGKLPPREAARLENRAQRNQGLKERVAAALAREKEAQARGIADDMKKRVMERIGKIMSGEKKAAAAAPKVPMFRKTAAALARTRALRQPAKAPPAPKPLQVPLFKKTAAALSEMRKRA